MDFCVVIPARYDAKRLPGKVLLDIHGKTMLEHVHEKAIESGASEVVIATDDHRIADAAKRFHATVKMTSSEHMTGTHRTAEVASALAWDDDRVIVNLQADEPMIDPKLVAKVAQDLEDHDNIKVASACQPITDVEEMFNPSVVKVVLNRRGYAMYFSRGAIPFDRHVYQCWQEGKTVELPSHCYKHLGLYAYRAGFLQSYLEWEGCPEETIEGLEQLRVLWNGAKIHVAITANQHNIGVDTQEDYEQVLALMKNKAKA